MLGGQPFLSISPLGLDSAAIPTTVLPSTNSTARLREPTTGMKPSAISKHISPSAGPWSNELPGKCHGSDFEDQLCSQLALSSAHPYCDHRPGSRCSPWQRCMGTHAVGAEKENITLSLLQAGRDLHSGQMCPTSLSLHLTGPVCIPHRTRHLTGAQTYHPLWH